MESLNHAAEHVGRYFAGAVKPCPFCKSCQQNTFEIDADTWAVYCGACNAIGPHGASFEEARKRWSLDTDD
jgi:hypothetical protein